MMNESRWSEVQELFHAVCALQPGERDPFLQSANPTDPTVVEEVRSLLVAHDSGDPLIERAVQRAADSMVGERVLGRRVGRWRLLQELGRGGMGTVYLAERADGEYEQKVALKIIRPGRDSRGILPRFRRERQILARLEHPRIARLLDGGVSEDGRPYFAMEYVEGEPIDRYCDRHQLSVDERIALFSEVCSAVLYAHQALVVHRDLKPDNILVTAAGEVRLLDFGIARVLENEGSSGAATETLLAVMTPAYASPEQVRGMPVGTGTDIYSLGLIFYELLCGVRPYDIETRNLVEVERIVCGVEHDRPSARLSRIADDASEETGRIAAARRTDFGKLRRKLAGDLDVICMKALRKEPERRYGSAEALMLDLRRYLEGRPVEARPDTLGYRFRKWASRRRYEVAAGSAALVAIIGLTAFFLLSLAEERDHARVEAAKAAEVANFLQSLFEVSDPSESRGESVTARELLSAGAARIQTELDGQPEVRASMMAVIGDVQQSLGLMTEARPVLIRALEDQRALLGDVHPDVAATQLSLAALEQDLGDLESADSLFRRTLTTRRQLFGDRHPAVGEALNGLAFLEETKGEEAVALQLYREALEVARAAHPPGDRRIAYAEVKLGGLLRRTNDLDAAEPLLRDGLAVQRSALGTPHPEVASTIRNLAALLRDRGDFAEADTLYVEAIAMRRTLYGNDEPSLAVALNSHALLLERMGERGRAIEATREAIALQERIYDGPHRALATGYHNLAKLVGGVEGMELFRRSLEISSQSMPLDHPNQAFPRMGLAMLFMTGGRAAEAEPLLREALEIRQNGLRPGHRYIGESLSALGACLTILGRFEEAEEPLLEARELLLAAEGPDSGRYRLVEARLAALYEAWSPEDRGIARLP